MHFYRYKYFTPTSMHTHTYRPAIYIIYKKTIIKRYILNINKWGKWDTKRRTHIYIYIHTTLIKYFSWLSNLSTLSVTSKCQDFYWTWLYTLVTQRVSYKKQELLTLREHLDSSKVFGGIRVAHVFSFLCCIFDFVCLHSVSCVPNVAIVSGLSILDYLFGFL